MRYQSINCFVLFIACAWMGVSFQDPGIIITAPVYFILAWHFMVLHIKENEND